MDKYESIHGKDVSSFDFASTREFNDDNNVFLHASASLIHVRSTAYDFSSTSLG